MLPGGPGTQGNGAASPSSGRLICYLNGQVALDTKTVQGDFTNWTDHHLLFGDEWKDPRTWHGLLDHIAIHSRTVGAKEAAARHKLATGGG